MDQGNPFVASFQTGRHYKVHKSYIWVGPAVALVAVVVVGSLNSISSLVQLGMAIQSGEIGVNVPLVIGLAVLAVLVLFGLLVGLYALGWRNMSYVFDEREFSFYSGIITRRRVHVPYARVQSVNHRASIVQRIVGVCTVAIDSAGGSSNKAIRIPYLRLETAERMRAELFMRKAAVAAGAESAVVYDPRLDSASAEGARAEADLAASMRGQAPVAPTRTVAEGAATESMPAVQQPAGSAWSCPQCGAVGTEALCGVCGCLRPQSPNTLDEVAGFAGDWRGVYGGATSFGEEPVSYEYGLSNRELLLTSLSHDTPIMVAVIVGLSVLLSFAFVLLAQDAAALFLSRFALAGVIASAIITWLLGLVGVAFSYGNFRARRRGSRIEVERGLLAREFSGIDIERVQSVEVRQSFIRRCIGYCELSLGRIDAAGEQNSGNNNSKGHTKGLVIHPFVKLDRVDAILDGLAPELADRPRRSECAALPAVALRRALLRRCLWFNWVLWTCAAVLVCLGALAMLANANVLHFANATARAQYYEFLTGSAAILAAVCVVYTVARGFGAVLWARHSGYTWNRRYLLVYNDGLSTGQSIIPRQKIQAAATRTNPFQRRLSLATLQAVTAAGTRSTTARLIDVPAEDCDAYLEWAKPRR